MIISVLAGSVVSTSAMQGFLAKLFQVAFRPGLFGLVSATSLNQSVQRESLDTRWTDVSHRGRICLYIYYKLSFFPGVLCIVLQPVQDCQLLLDWFSSDQLVFKNRSQLKWFLWTEVQLLRVT